MSSPNAKPGGKGTSTGNKWMALPIPHKLQPTTWRIEQGVLSSFLRTSKNANIPLQLNFTGLDESEDYIEILKDTPMMQYVARVSQCTPTPPRTRTHAHARARTCTHTTNKENKTKNTHTKKKNIIHRHVPLCVSACVCVVRHIKPSEE